MPRRTKRSESGPLGRSLSRRSLFGAGALVGLAAMIAPCQEALAWSSWTNATSPALKSYGMGDCVHEDLVQIAYARMIRNHANDTTYDSLLNPWAGLIQGDGRTATIAGDTVTKGSDNAGNPRTFTDSDDLALRLFRENLAYLRIGSFWNDAAANTLADFSYSCYHANAIPKFSGADHYEGAWDVGQHISETNAANGNTLFGGLDALVQFTMNDRNNFIHGMLSSTASHSAHLKQSEVKQFALQWLGVAYEYARTGEVTATSDVTLEQAEKIFNGFIDTYGQLDKEAHDMRVSLKVSNSEASIKLPRRRLRLRALGMMCHTLEDLWCPAHTCRTYRSGGGIPQNSILAFSNYKLQNGNRGPMNGYHIPFDRYATSDSSNSVNWREALTRGAGAYKGTEMLANVLDESMGCLDQAHTYFNTLGMNESIACITQLFEYVFQGTPWDGGVRDWVDTEVMPTYFNANGQSFICDAGRRSLHTPTYITTPIKAMSRAYSKVGLRANYNELLDAANSYNDWQRGTHKFFSGKFNTGQSKYVTSGHEGSSIWDEEEGVSRLVTLANKLYEGYSSLNPDKRDELLRRASCNRCHDMVSAIDIIGGMLQEFSIEMTGSLRPEDDVTMAQLAEIRTFFVSGVKAPEAKVATQSVGAQVLGMLSPTIAYADEDDEIYVTTNMALDNCTPITDDSGIAYLIAVRDLDSLETSIMTVPENTPGIEKLAEGLANLTITYRLDVEFEDDPDYLYIVTNIDYIDMKDAVYLATGTVKSVAADKKSLVLDLNGLTEYTLAIQEGLTDIPQVGDYICARYVAGKSALELASYGLLDAPGELKEATYPVEMINGSSVLLLTNKDDEGGTVSRNDGYRDYLEIEYGYADMYSMPVVGQEITVRYHDEYYDDETDDVDETAIASAGFETDFADVEAMTEAANEFEGVGTPGYIELGDEYGKLTYGNEVIHVANVFGTPDPYTPEPAATPENPPAQTPAAEITTPDASNQQTPADTSSKATQASSTPLARTADPLDSLGGLASAAAVTGAAAVAYSAYRTSDEEE